MANEKQKVEFSYLGDCWSLKKKFTPVRDCEEYWDSLVQEASAISQKYNNNENCKNLLFDIIDDLENKAKGIDEPVKQYKFSTSEIEKMIKRMVILVDSREKQNKHILEYFDRYNIPYEVSKLDYGDYSFKIPSSVAGEEIYFHRDVVIERKASLEELSGNFTNGRDAFEKEFLKANNDNAKPFLLVEAEGGYSAIISHNYNTDFKPSAYIASLETWQHRYKCNISFIDKQYSGFFIFNTFKYFLKENLR